MFYTNVILFEINFLGSSIMCKGVYRFYKFWIDRIYDVMLCQ
jgi:hypothetical protein